MCVSIYLTMDFQSNLSYIHCCISQIYFTIFFMNPIQQSILHWLTWNLGCMTVTEGESQWQFGRMLWGPHCIENLLLLNMIWLTCDVDFVWRNAKANGDCCSESWTHVGKHRLIANCLDLHKVDYMCTDLI